MKTSSGKLAMPQKKTHMKFSCLSLIGTFTLIAGIIVFLLGLLFFVDLPDIGDALSPFGAVVCLVGVILVFIAIIAFFTKFLNDRNEEEKSPEQEN